MKKNLFLNLGLLLPALFLALFACEKQPVDDRIATDPADAVQAEKGSYSKTLALADASGANSALIEVSADDEATLAAFGPSVFRLEAVEDLREAGERPFVTEAEKVAAAEDLPAEALGGERFWVNVLSQKMVPGVKALRLDVDLDRAQSGGASDRAAYYIGIFGTGASSVGITNGGGNCTASATALFQYKSGDTWLNWSGGGTALWPYFSNKVVCSGGINLNNSTLLTNAPGQLRNFKGKDWPYPVVSGVFNSTNGHKVRMLVWGSTSTMTNTGQALGVFVFG